MEMSAKMLENAERLLVILDEFVNRKWITETEFEAFKKKLLQKIKRDLQDYLATP